MKAARKTGKPAFVGGNKKVPKEAMTEMPFKKGGKVVDGEGKKPKGRGDRKERKSGGRVSPFSTAHKAG